MSAMIDVMGLNPAISTDSISGNTGMDRIRISRIVNRMKEERAIERAGGTRGRWAVILDGRSVPMRVRPPSAPPKSP